jgi:hypothetical protein
MKKIIIALLAAVSLPAALPAQELNIGGEAKSGIYWEQTQRESEDPAASVTLHSKDDAGGGRGRYRLNLDYDNGKGFGMRARLNWEAWSDTQPQWGYAFGYGNFFEDQLAVSVGKLGGSPWGTGGPEMWKELEGGAGGGMRVEWKPSFIPVGKLNAGFVLNYFNSDRDQGSTDIPISLFNILRETVLGVSYTHDLFMVRLAYRFDDEMDAQQDNKLTGGKGEDEMVYRVEEYVLRTLIPDFSVWALGHLYGLSSELEDLKWFRNWLFIQYAPELFTAQLRIGYDYITSRSDFYIKPSFYLNLFDRLLSVGASFEYCQDFGDGKVHEGSAYRYIMVEPRIQLNFTSSYIAFAYNFKQEYLHPWTGLREGREPLLQTQWMNLRFCIYY